MARKVRAKSENRPRSQSTTPKGKCFNGEKGHFARDCPHPPKRGDGPEAKAKPKSGQQTVSMVFLHGVPPEEFVPPVLRARRVVGQPHGHDCVVGQPHGHDHGEILQEHVVFGERPHEQVRLVAREPVEHDHSLCGMVEQHVRFSQTEVEQADIERGSLFPQHVVDEVCASNLWMHEEKAWLIDSGASSHLTGESMLEHVRVLEETGVCVQCSLASGEPMTLTRKVKVEVSFVAADLSIIRAQLSALVCANASRAILSTGCLARKGWSVVISEVGVDVTLANLSLGATWYANVGWVHSVSYKNTSLTDHHVSEVLHEGRAILGRREPPVVAVQNASSSSATSRTMVMPCSRFQEELEMIPGPLESVTEFTGGPSHGRRGRCTDGERRGGLQVKCQGRQSKDSKRKQQLGRARSPTSASGAEGRSLELYQKEEDVVFDAAGVEEKESTVPAVDCWWVATDKESLSNFDLLQHQLPYSSSCEVCVRARGLKAACRRTEISEPEVQLDQFWHGALRFLVVVRSKSFAIGCVSRDNAREVIVADMSHWLSHFGLANQTCVFTCDAEGYMRTLWQSLLERFPVFKGNVEQFAAGRHAPVAERAVRTLRESVNSVLLQMQDSHVGLRNHRRAYTLVFQHACHIHNRYSIVAGSVPSPLQRLRKNQRKPHQAYVFGATILTSGPPAKAAEIVGRFAYGSYLGPILNKSSHWTSVQLKDGAIEIVQSPSVKLVLPIRFDLVLLGVLGKRVGSVVHRLPRLPDLERVEDDLSVVPLALTEDGNPPKEWLLEHGRTRRCTACERGLFHGVKRSVCCRKRYRAWLDEQRANSPALPSREDDHPPTEEVAPEPFGIDDGLPEISVEKPNDLVEVEVGDIGVPLKMELSVRDLTRWRHVLMDLSRSPLDTQRGKALIQLLELDMMKTWKSMPVCWNPLLSRWKPCLSLSSKTLPTDCTSRLACFRALRTMVGPA